MEEFIRIPNLTTMCDPTYLENGEMEKCIASVDKYVQMIGLKGLKREIFELKECKAPPLVVYTIEGKESEKNTMIYGHLDKQPYGAGWDADKEPTDPVRVEDRLYGRGGADDGYSVFSAMLALKAI
jgi:acetylornithine deacetylase/succinyl-diaminopimelate desuccinylase-like protein